MSFWDNNKESIIGGAKSAAVVTGKYGYRGAKFVGKTGYQAAKNQRDVNAKKQQGKSGEESPFSGEARPLNSLPSVDHLPPPPLKPGQGQYSGKSRSAGQGQATLAQPVDPSQQQFVQQPVQQPVQPGVQQQIQPAQQQYQQPVQQVQQLYQQQPVQQVASQPPLPQRTLPQPPQQQVTQTTAYTQQPFQQQPGQVPDQPQYAAATTQQAFVQQPVQAATQAQQPAQQLSFEQSLQQGIQNKATKYVQSPEGQQALKNQAHKFVQSQGGKEALQKNLTNQAQNFLQSQDGQQIQGGQQTLQQGLANHAQKYAQSQEGQQALKNQARNFVQYQGGQQALQQNLTNQAQIFLQPQQTQETQQPVQAQAPVATTTAPVLDFQNPYYQGAISQPQEYKVEPLSNESSPAQTPAQNASAPPPPALGPRTYNRAAALPPPGGAQPDAMHHPEAQVRVVPQELEQPQPQLTVNTNLGNSTTNPPLQQVASLNSKEETVQSPDLSRLPLPPKHKDITPTGSHVASPSMKSTAKLHQASTGGSSNLGKADPSKHGETPDEEAHKGISGSYDYKIDVKFAPPPKPRGSAPSSDHHKPISHSSTGVHAAPARISITSPKTQPVRQSPVPTPARPSSTTTAFPPPPTPSRTLNHPPPTPSRISAASSANVSDVEDNSSAHPPPPYAATAETDSHSAQSSTTQLSRPPPKTFAPPPKPFRRPNEGFNERSKPEPPSRSNQPPPGPPIRTGSDVSALSLPPPVNPTTVEASKPKKASPPVVKPKPSNIDTNGTKKQAPPAIKPKPSNLAGDKKTPPPIPKKKPGIPTSSRTALGSAAGNFSAVVSELPGKNKDQAIPVKNNQITKEDLGAKKEDEDEDFEDNPFKRYLKNAVPKEDDRFKR